MSEETMKFVEDQLGAGRICTHCNATLATVVDQCPLPLVRCEGFLRIRAAIDLYNETEKRG
jgi:ribosomal protein L40E